MKKLLLLSILLTGCASIEPPKEPTSPTPIYPPLYDVRPIRELLPQAQSEAKKLKQFVDRSGRMMRLQWALEAYLSAADELYNEIIYAPPAQVSYEPWQIY